MRQPYYFKGQCGAWRVWQEKRGGFWQARNTKTKQYVNLSSAKHASVDGKELTLEEVLVILESPTKIDEQRQMCAAELAKQEQVIRKHRE